MTQTQMAIESCTALFKSMITGDDVFQSEVLEMEKLQLRIVIKHDVTDRFGAVASHMKIHCVDRIRSKDNPLVHVRRPDARLHIFVDSTRTRRKRGGHHLVTSWPGDSHMFASTIGQIFV